jgi:hypothetical protein
MIKCRDSTLVQDFCHDFRISKETCGPERLHFRTMMNIWGMSRLTSDELITGNS